MSKVTEFTESRQSRMIVMGGYGSGFTAFFAGE